MRSQGVLAAVRLGVNSLLLHKLRSGLTTLGVLFGTSSVIAMLAIGEGASAEAQEQIKRLGSQNVILRSVKPPEPPNVGNQRTRVLSYGLTREDQERVQSSFPAIDSVVPLRLVTKEVRYQDRSLLAPRIMATTPQWLEVTGRTVAEGRWITDTDMAGMRKLIADLLAEVTAIRGEGDYEAARKLFEASVVVDAGLREEVTLRASIRGGMLNYTKGSSRTIDRVSLLGDYLRGFEPDGVGPRQYTAGTHDNALGGNMFLVGSLEAEFPLGLPDEYGITGGAFYDIANVWSVGASAGGAGDLLYNGGSFRHVVGLSIFWETPIGPLQFDFAKALKKEARDREQFFNLSIRSEF